MLSAAVRKPESYHFACVMVLPYWCQVAERRLRDSDVKVGTVVGYPLGVLPTAVKVYEAQPGHRQRRDGTRYRGQPGGREVAGLRTVQRDIEEVVTAAKLSGLTDNGDDILAKIIIEVGMTSRDEQTRVCRIAKSVRADFIKTCTGQGPRGVTVQDVKHIRQVVGREMGVKASGGIRNIEQAIDADQRRREPHRDQHRRSDRGGLRPVAGDDDGGSAAVGRM